MRRPDIAIFIRSLQGGGAEKALVTLAHAFIDQGYSVDLLLPRAQGPYLETLSPKVNLIDLNSPRVIGSLPKLITYLRRAQPTSLLAALHYTAEIALWAKKLSGVSTRVVVSERNTLSVEAQNSRQLSVRLSPLAARLFYPWADEIVAISNGVADDLIGVTHIARETVRVIYNPAISPDLVDKSKQPVSHPWLQDNGVPVILAVGRLHPQKDFETLIHAFNRVQKVNESRLIILGQGPEEHRLRKLIADLDLKDSVDLPGFVQNPYAYMAKAAAFVLSSKYEGFGNVIVEALAAKTTVISTDCPSGPAEILDGGKYGYLVPVGDDDAMARSILRVLEGEKKTVSDRWLQQFTPENCTHQYLSSLGFTPRYSDSQPREVQI